MTQLRTVLTTTQAPSSIVIWSIAGLVALVVLLELVRPQPAASTWSRPRALAFPLATLLTLAVAPLVPQLRVGAFEVAFFVRMVGFWGMVVTAPVSVGQSVGLRPPRWLQRVHLTLAVVFLTLWVGTDLVFTHTTGYRPAAQLGPLASALLLPVGALAGWWLLSTLPRVPTNIGIIVFALGGSTTTLALVVAGLVIDPGLTDHMLVVAYLPVLLASVIVAVMVAIRDRRPPVR